MADEYDGSHGNHANSNLPCIPKDVLQDLCSRFLINIPDNEKNDMVRICFQIELAHWYYIDFCRQDDPDLPACGMKSFIAIIFVEFPFLNKTKQSIPSIYENWKKYKVRVPVFGAILLDQSLEKCLLVQGFHSKTSWGFPKGKVNKDEEDLDCAIREVYEEVGYDIKPLAHRDQYLENNIHDHQVRLYIIPGVDENYSFKPKTRGEIKEIRWFKVKFLPTHKKDTTPKDAIGLMPNNFFMIHTFVKPLRKWISDKKNVMSSRSFESPLLMQPEVVHQSFADPDPLINKKKRDRAAEEYKRMHEQINPFFTGGESKDMSWFGVTDMSGPSSQREAIRKLLMGTLGVSPGSTPEKSDNRLDNSYQPKPFDDPSWSNGMEVNKTRPDSIRSNRDESTRFFRNDQNKHSIPERNRHSMYTESYAQKASRGVSKDPWKNDPSRRNSGYENRTYSPKSQHLNSSANTSRKSLYKTDPHKGPFTQHGNAKSQDTLSDFYYSSPAFSEFRFNYEKILAVLT